MDILFGSTAVIEDTAHTSRTSGLFKATLSFLLIFLGGTLLSNILITIPTYMVIYTNDEFIAMISSGIYDEASLYELLTKIIEGTSWMDAAQLIATVGMIIAVIFFSVKLDGRRIFSLGFVKDGAIKEYISGLGIGLAMFTVVAAIVLASGDAKIVGFGSLSPLFALYLIGFLIQGMSEEILLRGYYFVAAASKGQISMAVFVSSAAFSLLHAGNMGINLIGLLNIFLFGFFASLYFLRRGSIWGISAIHSMWNFAQGNIFGFNVSGNALDSSILQMKYSSVSELFTGGAFGPEGGIAVSIVLFLGIVALLFFKNKEVEIPIRYSGEFFSA